MREKIIEAIDVYRSMNPGTTTLHDARLARQRIKQLVDDFNKQTLITDVDHRPVEVYFTVGQQMIDDVTLKADWQDVTRVFHEAAPNIESRWRRLTSSPNNKGGNDESE